MSDPRSFEIRNREIEGGELKRQKEGDRGIERKIERDRFQEQC